MEEPLDHAALLDEMHHLAAQQQAIRRRMIAVWRDVHALGGMPPVTGYTPTEWLELVTRMSGFDARRLELFATRLPAMPATAVALHEGAITVDQAAHILEGCVRLSGDQLAAVDRDAVAIAREVNDRSDHPDLRDDVDRLVRDHRPARDVERTEATATGQMKAYSQARLTGGGWVYAEYATDADYITVSTALEHAAGRPSPDVPRTQQRAAGLLAMASAWCAAPERGSARPAVTVLVDLADASVNNAATLLKARGRQTARINQRTLDTLACDADLTVQVVDGRRPLAELKGQESLPDVTRRVVKQRDRGCRWPGCAAPAWQVDVHHLVHREHGGDHDVDNLVCLCRRHHRMLHGPRWTARLDGETAAFRLWRGRRRAGRDPTHVTYPHGTGTAGAVGDGRSGVSDGGAGEDTPPTDVAGETRGGYALSSPSGCRTTTVARPTEVLAHRRPRLWPGVGAASDGGVRRVHGWARRQGWVRSRGSGCSRARHVTCRVRFPRDTRSSPPRRRAGCGPT